MWSPVVVFVHVYAYMRKRQSQRNRDRKKRDRGDRETEPAFVNYCIHMHVTIFLCMCPNLKVLMVCAVKS